MTHNILISILCGPERERWINPHLFNSLKSEHCDSRFSVLIENTYGYNRYETARNRAMQMARDSGADALVTIDNDMVLPENFFDILDASITSEKDIVGFPSARALLRGQGGCPDARERVFAGCVEALRPSEKHKDGEDFLKTKYVGSGVLIIRSEVWKRIPRGPWFKWLTGEDELMSPLLAEDYYFCELAEKHGLGVWSHRSIAGHLKTIDICNLMREEVQ